MPFKTTEAPSRAVEMSFDVPGSPAQVWAAVATGRGLAAWFVPAEIEEREGGHIVFHLGPDMGDSHGRVTHWEPPLRFRYVEPDWSGGAPSLETDIEIEPAAGGDGCIFRMAHRIVTDNAQWDDALVSMENGWASYLPVLRIYLAHFAGAEAATFRQMTSVDKPVREAWQPIARAWNLERAGEGAPLEADLGAELRIEGTLERLCVAADGSMCDAMVRLEEPAPGVAQVFAFSWNEKRHAGLNVIYYGAGAEFAKARDEPRWKDWFSAVTRAAEAG